GTNNESLWIVPPSGVANATMIVQQGTVLNLPDLPAGTYIPNSLVSGAGTGLNNLGQVAFNANFAGPGIISSPVPVNDRGVLAWDPVGGLMLVAQTGNNYGTVTAATQITPNPSFNGEGSCAAFSDTGWLPLIIGNSNTSNYGIFNTKI